MPATPWLTHREAQIAASLLGITLASEQQALARFLQYIEQHPKTGPIAMRVLDSLDDEERRAYVRIRLACFFPLLLACADLRDADQLVVCAHIREAIMQVYLVDQIPPRMTLLHRDPQDELHNKRRFLHHLLSREHAFRAVACLQRPDVMKTLAACDADNGFQLLCTAASLLSPSHDDE
jgi:hypothetical protein